MWNLAIHYQATGLLLQMIWRTIEAIQSTANALTPRCTTFFCAWKDIQLKKRWSIFYNHMLAPRYLELRRSQCLQNPSINKIYHPVSSVRCNYLSIPKTSTVQPFMMTSSNGNIFRVTGHLCGEFTGPRWIPRTKASDAELWCFLWSEPE